MISFDVAEERFPLAKAFTISRGTKKEAHVVSATLRDGAAVGRGECVPYARYGESADSVVAQLEAVRRDVEAGLDPEGLQSLLPAGAARNALDCALWDLEAKRRGISVWQLLGLEEPQAVTTAFTLSLGEPEAMRKAAEEAAFRPLLKLKLGGVGDIERLAAVREGAPESRLIVDANESWEPRSLEPMIDACARHRVDLIEQPLAAGEDEALRRIESPIPLCADESCHDRASLDGLIGLYDAINIKLDKTGGLTEALRLRTEARRSGLLVMVGCMVASSLAMAPALLVAQGAAFVDLDGPLLLAEDREPGLSYTGSVVEPAPPGLWG